jgi:hypothetical protein
MEIKDRVKVIKKMKAKELKPHPLNWRVHAESQKKALGDILRTLGAADVIKAYVNKKGETIILDGHLRVDMDSEHEWNVAILDFNDEEARQFLATYDPITEMAFENEEKLQELLKNTAVSSPGMELILKQLGDKFNVPFFIDGVNALGLGVSRQDTMSQLGKKNTKFVMMTVGEIGVLIPIEIYNGIVQVCNGGDFETYAEAVRALLTKGLEAMEVDIVKA